MKKNNSKCKEISGVFQSQGPTIWEDLFVSSNQFEGATRQEGESNECQNCGVEDIAVNKQQKEEKSLIRSLVRAVLCSGASLGLYVFSDVT